MLEGIVIIKRPPTLKLMAKGCVGGGTNTHLSSNVSIFSIVDASPIGHFSLFQTNGFSNLTPRKNTNKTNSYILQLET